MSTIDKTLKQVASLCAVSENHLRMLVNNGDIPHILTKNGEIRLNLTSINMVFDATRKRVICFYPAAASALAVESWLNKNEKRLFELVPYSADCDAEFFEQEIAEHSPLSRIVIFHPQLISRGALSSIIAFSSRQQADCILVNSTTLS